MKSGILISSIQSLPIYTFKGDKVLPIPMNLIYPCIKGIEISPKIDANMTDCKLLEQVSENTDIIYLRYKIFPPVISDRQFIVQEQRFESEDLIVVHCKSIENEAQFQQPGAVTGNLINGGWVLERVSDESTRVSYIVQADPKGFIPNWIANLFTADDVLLINRIQDWISSKEGKSALVGITSEE